MGCGFSALGSLDETKVHNITFIAQYLIPINLNFS